VGATSVITGKPAPANLLSLMARDRINSFFAPPTVWIALLQAPQFDGTDWSALRKGYYGASIMPVEVLKEIQRRMPDVRLWNLYGQTEIAPVATVLKPEDQLRKAGSAGRPTLNVETRLVDDDMNDVGQGEIGEIVHRSPQLLSGYYKDEERTGPHLRRLVPQRRPWNDRRGRLHHRRRPQEGHDQDGGENVSSREVERRSTPSRVSEVAVIGLPDPKWIEAVTAVIVAKPGCALTSRRRRRLRRSVVHVQAASA
jgi:fatty-acyl-CoA synthase